MTNDTLRVYRDNQLIFSSIENRLRPLLEYVAQFTPHRQQVVIFDKIMGNAAALLSVVANCREVYSPLGSQLAVKTLDDYDIKCHISKIVPYIQQSNEGDMCPMEKLSIGREPEEFYELIRSILK